jgi:hypothetical protein
MGNRDWHIAESEILHQSQCILGSGVGIARRHRIANAQRLKLAIRAVSRPLLPMAM